MGDDESVEEAFYERNQAVFLLLAAMKDRGHTVGYRVDEDEDWPIVFAGTPAGQMAWHVPRDDLPNWLERKDVPYDGHTNEEKHQRMQDFADYLGDSN